MEKDIKNIPTDELLKELKSRGYLTDIIWKVSDVHEKAIEIAEDLGVEYNITNDHAMRILEEAFLNKDMSSENEYLWDIIEGELKE